MEDRAPSLREEYDAYLTDYIRRIRRVSPMAHAPEESKAELRGLLQHLSSAQSAEGAALLEQLLLLMLYFGTSLTSDDLCALRVEHVSRDGELRGLPHPQGGPDGGPEGDARAVWSQSWSATAARFSTLPGDGLSPLRGSQGGRAPLDRRPQDDAPGPQPSWLDEECALVLDAHLKARSEGDALFRGAGGAPLCRDDIYERVDALPEALAEAGSLSHFFPIYSVDDYQVIPTPLRLNADPRFTGKGVTIAFIDSGFYPHPDLTEPENRIVAYRNIPQPHLTDFSQPQRSSWHGMQTSVSAAGNGFLSRGLYRGLASDANVVLLRVSGPKGIEIEHILAAFKWVAEHKDRYNIRVVNVSLGGGPPQSSRESDIDQAAEALVQMGIAVVVAAGNAGHSQDHRIRPPASAPSVITVGGVNDNNRLNFHDYEMYWSSYGFTVDGILKPDVIAPGIWVAAPLLPGTPIAEEARLLLEIEKAPDAELPALIRSKKGEGGWPEGIIEQGPEAIRAEARARQDRSKVVPPHYQHVDGTSFAAPIVCSVVAQMVEANPELTPQRIKELLVNTTDRLFRVPIEQQGNGMIHPRKAVKEAINDLYREGIRRPNSPYVSRRTVTFYYVADEADVHTVALSGSFNGWSAHADPLTLLHPPYLWSTTLHFDAPGSYAYKFVVHGRDWCHDPENLNREPDGYGGYNSMVVLMT